MDRSPRSLFAALAFLVAAACGSSDETLRGTWTWGHEVRSFCPETSDECYWLSDTDSAVRDELRELGSAGEPYAGVCIVIEGSIDRASERPGLRPTTMA